MPPSLARAAGRQIPAMRSFQQMQSFEHTPPEARTLLSRPIRELGLRVEGSTLERYVQQLYAELEGRGLSRFRPGVYLSDEWACPDREPVIGVPFYLADPKLQALERAVNDLEDEREILMYLRHEAGHAFNYAYMLYESKEWLDLFGPFDRPYLDDYTPVPFSRKYVRHIAGWYAQKHPDEDFAETFAVWLTPDSDWRRRYAGWPALKKLQYVERIARELATLPPRKAPEVAVRELPVEEMGATLEQFTRSTSRTKGRRWRTCCPTRSWRTSSFARARICGRPPPSCSSIARPSSTRSPIGPASAGHWCASWWRSSASARGSWSCRWSASARRRC